MFPASLLIAAILISPGADARLETLRSHFERLEQFEVPAAAEAERTQRRDAVGQHLGVEPASAEAFDALYKEVDDYRMWLWQQATNKPAPPNGGFEDQPDAWVLRNAGLELRWLKSDWSLQVRHGQQEWRFAPCNPHDVVYIEKPFGLRDAAKIDVQPFPTGYSVGLSMMLSDFPAMPGLALVLTVNLIGDEIVFEISAPKEPEAPLQWVQWPKSLITGNTAEDAAVIPLMQGMLLPGNWPQKIVFESLCHSRTLYMPWWGQLEGTEGVTTILETDADAGVSYEHLAGGPTVIQPRWYASLGELRYLRTVRYSFAHDSGYVPMAKRFRRYVKEQGEFVSLEEKRVASPALNEVIGRPVIHIGALYHFVQEASLFNKTDIMANHSLNTFAKLAEELRSVRAKGLDDAYVHLDGWGFYGYDNGHPDVLPPGPEQGGWEGLRAFADTCDELGFLFAVHDQYRDFYLNAASFDDRLVALRLDGTREQSSTWCGGPQTILSPRFAPEYVRRNHDLFAANGVEVKGAYLDVFSVVPLEESAQAAHPVTRSECAEYRRDCFDLLRARGYVVSSEEPTDYLVRSLHLVHHGPYATYPRIGGGDATAIPIPLFNLVYHDSLLLPWEMGPDGGWGIPKGDSGRLHCLLNGGLPYVGTSGAPEEIAMVKGAAALAARVGTQEMVNHEFLSEDHRQQRSTFADGTQVTVNFATGEAKIDTH